MQTQKRFTARALTALALTGVVSVGAVSIARSQYTTTVPQTQPIVLNTWVPVAVGPNISRSLNGANYPNIQPLTNYPEYDQVISSPLPNILPRTSDQINVSRYGKNQIRVQWQGEPRAVRQVVVATFDKYNRVLDKQVFTQMPVDARLKRDKRTDSYGVHVEYLNGAGNTIYAPVF